MRTKELKAAIARYRELYGDGLLSSVLVATGKNNTYVNRDYEYALRVFTALSKVSYIQEGIDLATMDEGTALSLLSPGERYFLKVLRWLMCVSYSYDDLGSASQRKLLVSDSWAVGARVYGTRALLTIFPTMDGSFDIHLFCRGADERTGSNIDLWESLGSILGNSVVFRKVYVLDVEITSGLSLSQVEVVTGYKFGSIDSFISFLLQSSGSVVSEYSNKSLMLYGTPLVYLNAIYPLVVGGSNYKDTPMGTGLQVLGQVVQELCRCGLNISMQPVYRGSREFKITFLSESLRLGFKGMMFYNLESTYKTGRCSDCMVKIRRPLSLVSRHGFAVNSMEAFNGFISGLRRGKRASSVFVEVSIFVTNSDGSQQRQPFAYIPVDAFSVYSVAYGDIRLKSGNKEILNPVYKGMVLELTGDSISASRKYTLRCPRILRLCFGEKSTNDCIYPFDVLRSLGS